MATIKETKEQLNELLKRLSEFNDTDEVVMSLDDNCGGSYPAQFNEFSVTKSDVDNMVYIDNY